MLEVQINKANKEIEKIKNKIAAVEKKIVDLESKLSIDDDVETYSAISIKIESYKKFIADSNKRIKQIQSNIYTYEDLQQEKVNIQSKYNKELKKSYKKFIDDINKALSSYEEYVQTEGNLIAERNKLNAYADAINTVANIYEGVGIKNDNVKKYEVILKQLKSIVDKNPVN